MSQLKGRLVFDVTPQMYAEFDEERKRLDISKVQLFRQSWESYKKDIGRLGERKEKKK